MDYSIHCSKRISQCKTCGEPNFWRFLELFEKQHQNQVLHFKRILIRQLGWTPFDVENPGLIHQHNNSSNDNEKPRPNFRPKTEVVA